MTIDDKLNSFYNRFTKRLLDIVFSFLLIIILFPFLTVIIVVNCFFTRFSPFFIQRRCGKNKSSFFIIKLRTLKISAPNYEKKTNIDFYTKIGFFLRKTHIDELPQLLNIFVGQMSFVGPRPMIFSYSELIELRTKSRVIELRPGLSGLAQVSEKSRELSEKEKYKFDALYLQKFSFVYDLDIVIRSVGVTFKNIF